MKGGFTFCGIDIADIGLEYAPETENTYVYNPANTNIHEETYEAHTGGYYYGEYKTPKEFTLRCIFEENDIRKGIVSKINHYFRTGKSGKLVFAKRPWCYYHATVISNPELNITNYLNGYVVIKMKAYYPFARSDLEYSDRIDPYHKDVMLNSAYPEHEYMLPDISFTEITQEENIILLNSGSERASVGIVCSGETGDGVVIVNNTTGQSCKFVGITNDITKNKNKEIFLDGLNGKTILRDENGNSELAFLYHEYGYIDLEPGFPALRDLYITYTHGSDVITATNMIYDNIDGKYIFAGDIRTGGWYKIINHTKHSIKVNKAVEASGSCKTMIVLMNEITIHPVSTINLHKLSFVYKSTFT